MLRLTAAPLGFEPSWFGVTFLFRDREASTPSRPWGQYCNWYGIRTRDLHSESVMNSATILTGYMSQRRWDSNPLTLRNCLERAATRPVSSSALFFCADTLIRTEMNFRPTVSRTVASDLVSPYPLMCGACETRTPMFHCKWKVLAIYTTRPNICEDKWTRTTTNLSIYYFWGSCVSTICAISPGSPIWIRTRMSVSLQTQAF